MTTGTSLPKEYLPLGWVFLYKIKRIIRVLDRYKAEVYNLEAITSLAFRIESFGAAKVLRALLERIIHGRKEKTTVFVSVVSDGKPNSRWKAWWYTNVPTCKRTSIPACKPITMVIYIAGSIPLFRGKRSNHFRLQRQSKHGALCRLKGQAAAPFPDKSSSRFAASVFIGKTLYPTAPYKRAFENGNDRPATDRKGKNKVGLYG